MSYESTTDWQTKIRFVIDKYTKTPEYRKVFLRRNSDFKLTDIVVRCLWHNTNDIDNFHYINKLPKKRYPVLSRLLSENTSMPEIFQYKNNTIYTHVNFKYDRVNSLNLILKYRTTVNTEFLSGRSNREFKVRNIQFQGCYSVMNSREKLEMNEYLETKISGLYIPMLKFTKQNLFEKIRGEIDLTYEHGQLNQYNYISKKDKIKKFLLPIKSEEECMICKVEKCSYSIKCGHEYCKDCITTWLVKQESCPYCRQSIN